MRTRSLAPLLILAACAAVFANTLHNGFHLDDFYRVVDNPGIEQVTPIGRHFVDPGTMSTYPRIVQFRPLLPLTLSLNHALHGYDLPGYHLGNLLLHFLSSLLVFGLCRELLVHWAEGRYGEATAGRMALAAALLFAVHPVSGIVVNYVSARDLALMELFLLGALFAYVRMRRLGSNARRWTVVLVCTALSLLSKTNSVVLPVLLLAFELVVARRPLSDKGPWLRALPATAVVLAFFAYTKLVLRFSDLDQVTPDGASFWRYPMAQVEVHLTHYLANFVWPWSIRQAPSTAPVTGPLDPAFVAGLCVILGSLVLAFRLRRRRPILAFAILAYWIALLPTSSVVPLFHDAAHYRPYPASPFFFLGAAIAGLLGLTPKARVPVCAAAVIYLAAASVWHNGIWRTEQTLWRHSVEHGGTELAHLNYAMSFADRTDPRVRRHLQQAIELWPQYVLAHVNLGLCLCATGEIEQGLSKLRDTEARYPDWAATPYWLGKACLQQGLNEEAAAAFARAARIEPRNLAYAYDAGRTAQLSGDLAGSLLFLDACEAIRPGHADVRFLRGFALQKAGREDEAIAAYRSQLELDPDHFQCRFNLGFALMQRGEHAAAIEHFEKVLALNSGYGEAHVHLATCYDAIGQPDRAADHREKLR